MNRTDTKHLCKVHWKSLALNNQSIEWSCIHPKAHVLHNLPQPRSYNQLICITNSINQPSIDVYSKEAGLGDLVACRKSHLKRASYFLKKINNISLTGWKKRDSQHSPKQTDNSERLSFLCTKKNEYLSLRTDPRTFVIVSMKSWLGSLGFIKRERSWECDRSFLCLGPDSLLFKQTDP